jgi:hypothetical protein
MTTKEKGFQKLTPASKVIKLFTAIRNKLECLYLAILSSQV